jgi:hypothetical protein
MPTIQEALAALQNPANMRQAVLSRLNINPGQYGANQVGGLGSNSDFDQQINDLYRQGAETTAGLDRSEGDTNTNYQRSLAQAAIDRDKALGSIRNNFATRGMSFSSANADELARANGEFDRYVGNLGEDRTTNLGDIANRRNSLIEGLGRGRQQAEEGFGSSISGFLNDQAMQAWNSALQAQQQRDLAAAMRPPPAINKTVIQRVAAPQLPTAPRPTAAAPTPYANPAVQVNKTVKSPYIPGLRGPQ